MKKIKRRDFMRTTGAAGLTLAAANSTVRGSGPGGRVTLQAGPSDGRAVRR